MASGARALELIAAPDVGFERSRESGRSLRHCRRMSSRALEADALYSGYLSRQEADIEALRKDEKLALPQRSRLCGAAQPVGRNAAEVAAGAAGDDRPGGAHRRHDAGGAGAVARPREARAESRKSRVSDGMQPRCSRAIRCFT